MLMHECGVDVRKIAPDGHPIVVDRATHRNPVVLRHASQRLRELGDIHPMALSIQRLLNG
jgi:hypothetical protein